MNIPSSVWDLPVTNANSVGVVQNFSAYRSCCKIKNPDTNNCALCSRSDKNLMGCNIFVPCMATLFIALSNWDGIFPNKTQRNAVGPSLMCRQNLIEIVSLSHLTQTPLAKPHD